MQRPGPPGFWERLECWLPAADVDRVAYGMQAPRDLVLRPNPLRADPDAALAALHAAVEAAPVPGLPQARVIPAYARAAALRLDLVQRGALYAQSVGSQWAALAVGARPGEAVLDLCAAPGSKTSMIAASMHNEGRLVAVEASRSRMFKLKANLARLGAAAEVIGADAVAWARARRGRFDRALVDAPCSGEGRWHVDDPDGWSGWSPKAIRALASRQKALLHAALDAVRPGGVVVYSTCTLDPEENELVLARALQRYPGLSLEPVNVDALPGLTAWAGRALPEALRRARRFLPSPSAEGFFLARLRRP